MTLLQPGLPHQAIANVLHTLLWLPASTQPRPQAPGGGSQKLAQSHWLCILATEFLLCSGDGQDTLPQLPDMLKEYSSVCSTSCGEWGVLHQHLVSGLQLQSLALASYVFHKKVSKTIFWPQKQTILFPEEYKLIT